MLIGGWVGGAITYVYGMRVISETDKPARDAILKPKFPPDWDGGSLRCGARRGAE